MAASLRQFTVLKPGDVILDFSGWRPTAEQLRNLNVKAVGRYIAQTTRIAGKLLTPGETAFYHSLGIAVIPLYESYATRPDGGRSLGLIDGAFAQRWGESVDYPLECKIVATDDTDVTASTLPHHLQYQIGFDDACTSWGTGPYGDNDILQACIDAGRSNEILVYAGAKAWSGYHPPIPECHIEQTVAGSIQGVYDMNRVLRPINAWLPNNNPWEGDMAYGEFYGNEAGTIWRFMEDGYLREIGYPVEYELVGSPVIDAAHMLTNEQVAALTKPAPTPAPVNVQVDTEAIATAVVNKIPPYPTKVTVDLNADGHLG